MLQELTSAAGSERSQRDGSFVPFGSGWEHLESELRCLDPRLKLAFLRQPAQQAADGLSPFKGLVIGDAEVARLLAGAEEPGELHAEERAGVWDSLAEMQRVCRGRVAASREAGVFLPRARLAELFGLSGFEQECLVVCAAPEIERRYERLYGYLQDDATRKRAGLDLVLGLLVEERAEKVAARESFLADAPLMTFRLLEWASGGAEGEPALSRMLKVDDRILSYLLGSMQVDARLKRVARLVSPVGRAEETLGPREFYGTAHAFVGAYLREPAGAGRNLILSLHGPANADVRTVVEELCHGFGFAMLVADAEAMKAGPLAFAEAAWLLGREAALQSAVLVVENMDCLSQEPDKHAAELKALVEAAKTFSRITFLCGTEAWHPGAPMPACVFLSQAVPGPDLGTCRRLWESGLAGRAGVSAEADAGELAGKFRFGARQIADALNTAEGLARWRSPDELQVTAPDIYAACRTHSSPRLGALARKIEARYTWDDIVLPEDNLAQLQALCEQARHRQLVYGEWGFDRKLSLGKGLNALFLGPPGTGKTMAAEVIARALRLDLYRIDLSQIVSKYIGETEKNLHGIFAEAQAGNAILFFDEADALFGKRSEVKDAHDRFANIEVGYLLQKMEEYEGVAILATNLGRNMDEAFARRMHFIIEFPFPDEQYRRQIWEVAFPREAPLAQDVDFEVLAHEIRLSGGNIKNIALAAAFYAAGNGRVIGMPHLWQAARREHQKLGRTWEWTPPVVAEVGRGR